MDEQGLGKTLQTLSFLVWLNEHMKQTVLRRPILIVASTSLLKNWEEEAELHVAKPGLGFLVRLYGTAISARKRPGQHGQTRKQGKRNLIFLISTTPLNGDAGILPGF